VFEAFFLRFAGLSISHVLHGMVHSTWLLLALSRNLILLPPTFLFNCGHALRGQFVVGFFRLAVRTFASTLEASISAGLAPDRTNVTSACASGFSVTHRRITSAIIAGILVSISQHQRDFLERHGLPRGLIIRRQKAEGCVPLGVAGGRSRRDSRPNAEPSSAG